MESAMIKMLVLAIWASAVTALSSYGATQWRATQAAAPSDDKGERKYEYRKTRIINVPVIADGALLGYVIVQFLYAMDGKVAEKLNLNPDAFVLDMAFRRLYGDPSLDFRHLDKYDINGLTRQIAAMMNEKLGEGVVKEVLVQDFAYMPKDQAPR
jgi:hypothetical protein